MKLRIIVLSSLFLFMNDAFPQEFFEAKVHERDMGTSRNKIEREEWFQDMGFGLFVHWSVDSQIGSVVSHSMVGASKSYNQKFIEFLPKLFNPKRFDADDWATLFALSGAKYVVVNAKHHSGFCMFDSQVTDFDIMNTPFGRDLTGELIPELRKKGMAAGFYFSPDDFWFLHNQGYPVSRRRPEAFIQNNPALMKHDKAQLNELFHNYGEIDLLFMDFAENPSQELLDYCWDMKPNLVITRGAMHTPEEFIPGQTIPGPWEACMTMGTQWQYKPANEIYKDGTELIQMLIETRARGGNLLLNVGPKPNGEIPIEQEELLREIALWNLVNGEAIYNVRPWLVTNEGDYWFTKAKNENTVYVFITNQVWKFGEKNKIVLQSVKATDDSRISLLGHGGDILEYQPDINPQPQWEMKEDGLHITAMRAQRLYDDCDWPNPIVLKITNVNANTD